MRWVRDYRSRPDSLVLFQIFQRFAPLTDHRGLIWRHSVLEDACLQCHLLPGPRRGSFLAVRHGPRRELHTPLLHVEGQIEASFPDQLPIDDWLAKGTVWWLRNLGSVLLDNPLRLHLFHGLLELDRVRYPEVLEAVAYHPIVPLVDGSWISLRELRKFPVAYRARPVPGMALPGWLDECPVVQEVGSYARLDEFLDQPLQEAGGHGPEQAKSAVADSPPAWSYDLTIRWGNVRLSALKYQDGNCFWIWGEHGPFLFWPLFDEAPVRPSCRGLLEDRP